MLHVEWGDKGGNNTKETAANTFTPVLCLVSLCVYDCADACEYGLCTLVSEENKCVYVCVLCMYKHSAFVWFSGNYQCVCVCVCV